MDVNDQMDKDSTSQHNAVTLFYVAMIVIIFTLSRVSSWHGMSSPHDEGILLVMPEMILRGAIPNKDFWAVYGPGCFWVLAAAYKIFGTSLFVERAVGLSYQLFIVLGIFFSTKRWGLISAFASACIAITAFGQLGLCAFAWYGALAALIWAVYCFSCGSARSAFAAGALGGTAALFRPETIVAFLCSMVPFLSAAEKAKRISFFCGFLSALSLYGLHAYFAGLGNVIHDLYATVLILPAARRLPIFPSLEPWLTRYHVLLVLSCSATVVAGLSCRRGQKGDSRVLLSLGILASVSLSQVFQRADNFHCMQVIGLPLSLLPESIKILIDNLKVSNNDNRRKLAISVTSILAVCTFFNYKLFKEPEPSALQRCDFKIRHDGRYAFVQSQDEQEIHNQLFRTVDQLSRAGSKLFVGPEDLRKTPLTETWLYYFLPNLRPNSFFLEMDPLISNGKDSRMAKDIESSEILILTNRYDGWAEPNDSKLLGSDRPNKIVQEHFILSKRIGPYSVFVPR